MSDHAANAEPTLREHHQVQVTDAEAVALAVALHKMGRLEEADGIYCRILEAIPNQVDALHFHGLLLFQQGHRLAGIQAVRQAIGLRPEYADAHNNLGNMLKETGDDDGALQAYRRVLELRPDHADTYNNIGVLLRKRGQRQEALESYERAIALDPHHADAFHNMGNLLQAMKRWDEAVVAYRRAVSYLPLRDASYVELGRAYCRAGRMDEAAKVYRDWVLRNPDNPIAQHLAAACSGQAAPSRASDDYIRRTFDVFADSYDGVLSDIEYHVPELILGVLQGGTVPSGGMAEVLDAGCGTGLCGVQLRPHARRLIGVDLSAMMLSRARERGVYDELVEAELTEYLRGQPDRFGLIVSGDTLVYFGDLGPVFAAARTALQPGGWFLFSVERDEESEVPSGFRIHSHGRYSHTESYVRRALSSAALDVCWIRVCVLRMEMGEPVSGLLVLGQKARIS